MNFASTATVALVMTLSGSQLLAEVHDVYDLNMEQHHPLPLCVPPIVGTEVPGNPAASNPWVYGYCIATAGIPGRGTLRSYRPGPFIPFRAFDQVGADVMGGETSGGDINRWGDRAAPRDPRYGTIRMIDGPGGVTETTHDVANAESYLRGQVHIFTDDNPPNSALTIVRFEAPETGYYELDVMLENRIVEKRWGPDRDAFYNVYTEKAGQLQVIAEGSMPPGPKEIELGPGSGGIIEIVELRIALKSGEAIEIAGSTAGFTFPGGLIALFGRVTQVPGPNE